MTKVEAEPLEGSDHTSVTVETEQGRDLRSQIAARIVEQGIELFELKAVSLSLEDIFLQLTTEEERTAAATEQGVAAVV